MKKLSEFTIADVEGMDYNQLISLVKETNRPPGGYKTIASVIRNAFLTGQDRVLEIGTSTGVTAIELARLVGCQVDAIDINERSLEEARIRARAAGVGSLIRFRQEDAQAMTFPDGCFDMVFCGNVTSLIPDRARALSEYLRVLRRDGMLAAVPMYYLRRPSDRILEGVSQAIQTDVQLVSKDYWVDFYDHPELLLKLEEDYQFDYIPDQRLEKFCACILEREFLRELQPAVYDFLREKYRRYLYLFRDNLSHMGYSILLCQKAGRGAEPELFRGTLLGSVRP